MGRFIPVEDRISNALCNSLGGRIDVSRGPQHPVRCVVVFESRSEIKKFLKKRL